MPEATQHVAVPKADWNGRAADMRSRLVTWKWHWQLPPGKTALELDFTKVSFMEPWALAMFAAYGLGMRQRGVPVRGSFTSANPANAYVMAMGLDEILATGTSTAAARQWSDSHQNTGLHVIASYDDLDAFRRSTSRLYLRHCEDAADALRYALTEFGRNVLQHSGSRIGGVGIAQHFPDDRRLQVAMCDLGCGVRESLVPRYPELRTDMESLRLAVLPHASGAQPTGPYGGSENAGLGLFYAREIAWRARGSFWLASRTALLGIRGDLDAVWEQDDPQPDRVYRKIEPWPGTIVAIDFPVDGITDFASILAVCRDLAAEARRMSGPAGLDFVSSTQEMESAFTVRVRDFEENNQVAVRIRDAEIRPRVERGDTVVIDFSGVRSPTQSFVHALLAEVFRIPGSLVRLSFLDCSRPAREILKAVAAYASYRQIL